VLPEENTTDNNMSVVVEDVDDVVVEWI
jgi:hypothetical protein